MLIFAAAAHLFKFVAKVVVWCCVMVSKLPPNIAADEQQKNNRKNAVKRIRMCSSVFACSWRHQMNALLPAAGPQKKMITVDHKLVEDKHGNTRLQTMYFYQGQWPEV
jgi:hypothetical protein